MHFSVCTHLSAAITWCLATVTSIWPFWNSLGAVGLYLRAKGWACPSLYWDYHYESEEWPSWPHHSKNFHNSLFPFPILIPIPIPISIPFPIPAPSSVQVPVAWQQDKAIQAQFIRSMMSFYQIKPIKLPTFLLKFL